MSANNINKEGYQYLVLCFQSNTKYNIKTRGISMPEFSVLGIIPKNDNTISILINESSVFGIIHTYVTNILFILQL